ncbi:MAG TPA: hypothetical protein VFO11_00205 [Candidatus Polarisedimenticolaceae bacterium]|nr:hypothetical protein [Candidatus Polarisedimenticolaceae bacterium]
MRRSLPLGLFLFACVFLAFAIHLARAGGPGSFAPVVIGLVGVAGAGIAIGLWRRASWALPGFAAWGAGSLALGFWQELTLRRVPLSTVILWLVFGVLLYGAVGLYLHDALRGIKT